MKKLLLILFLGFVLVRCHNPVSFNNDINNNPVEIVSEKELLSNSKFVIEIIVKNNSDKYMTVDIIVDAMKNKIIVESVKAKPGFGKIYSIPSNEDRLYYLIFNNINYSNEYDKLIYKINYKLYDNVVIK